MKNNLGKLKHIACALTLGVCSMQGATAGIIFTHTQPGQGTLDNIRFGAEDGVVLQGTTVTGAVGPRSEMFLIDFIGNESLAVQSGSPTAFRAADGGLQRLDVGVRDGGFTSLFLNLRAQPGGTAASRYADIAVSAYGGETATYRLNFLPGMNANNLFQVSATGNTLLKNLAISSMVPITEIRQPRADGYQAVPEPGSVLSLGIGMAGLIAVRYRKHRAATPA